MTAARTKLLRTRDERVALHAFDGTACTGERRGTRRWSRRGLRAWIEGDGSAAARAFSMAFTHVHITLQHLGLGDEHAILFDRLASRVFGTDPSRSVLDTFCRAHDVDNLFVVDASFFPSSAAVNPGLTIIAQALRAADHLQAELS